MYMERSLAIIMVKPSGWPSTGSILQGLLLQGNAVDTVHLTNTTLVYLNLSSNNLSSVRGFESCTNLKYLNLSNNKISKLGLLILSHDVYIIFNVYCLLASVMDSSFC